MALLHFSPDHLSAPNYWMTFAIDVFLTLHQRGGNIHHDWSKQSEKRAALAELFDHILEHHEEYDEDTVLCADGFNARLDDFEFCFLIDTFNGIFEHADVLFGILQRKTLGVQFCLARVKEFCDAIERARGRFSQIYEDTTRISSGPSTRRGPGAAQGDLRTHYQQLHNNILCQIQNRFQDHKKWMFLSLLDPQHFQTYRRKFPHTAFSSSTESRNTVRSVPAKSRTDCNVCHDWFWRETSRRSPWFP